MPDEPGLLPHHIEQLTQGSGISLQVIMARGYRSIEAPDGYPELKRLGFSRPQATNLPGLLLPLWTTDGRNGLVVYRPDNPRLDRQGHVIKYEIPKGAGVHLDCPPPCRPKLGDPAIRLWITEGIKKGDALASYGLCVIDLLGVWNFKGENDFGGTTFLADWDHIHLKGRDVHIVFDSVDVSDVSPETLKVTASQIVEGVKALLSEEQEESEQAEAEEGEPPKWVNARSIGRILSKLRLKKDREPSRKREKVRLISAKEIANLAIAHHLVHLSGETSVNVHMSEPLKSAVKASISASAYEEV